MLQFKVKASGKFNSGLKAGSEFVIRRVCDSSASKLPTNFIHVQRLEQVTEATFMNKLKAVWFASSNNASQRGSWPMLQR